MRQQWPADLQKLLEIREHANLSMPLKRPGRSRLLRLPILGEVVAVGSKEAAEAPNACRFVKASEATIHTEIAESGSDSG